MRRSKRCSGSSPRRSACCCCSALSLALFFHFFAGIRHLVWDAGFGFEKPWYDRSAWAVVIATVAATLLLWIIGLAAQ